MEAALWGLPPGRTSSDVVDLGALLYAALTGKWAGVSRSAVPPAHQLGGPGAPAAQGARRHPSGPRRPLRRGPEPAQRRDAHALGVRPDHRARHRRRPRRLRRRPDRPGGRGVGHHRRDAGARPRRGGGLPGAAPRRLRAGARARAGARPRTRARARARARAGPRTARGRPVTGTVAGTRTVTSTDQPTQAGMPIFDDERDEVSWIAARAEKPPPPPPFEKAPERPLFAPEPPEGRPLRTPAAGRDAHRPGLLALGRDRAGPGRPGSLTGTQPGVTGTGSGIGLFDDVEDEGVPGRRWLRLAAVVGRLHPPAAGHRVRLQPRPGPLGPRVRGRARHHRELERPGTPGTVGRDRHGGHRPRPPGRGPGGEPRPHAQRRRRQPDHLVAHRDVRPAARARRAQDRRRPRRRPRGRARRTPDPGRLRRGTDQRQPLRHPGPADRGRRSPARGHRGGRQPSRRTRSRPPVATSSSG